MARLLRSIRQVATLRHGRMARRLPVTWLNTIWLTFFVESFGLKILGEVTTKLSQLHSNSRNKCVNSRKYHNVGHTRCMHARPHRHKDLVTSHLGNNMASVTWATKVSTKWFDQIDQ